MGRGGDKCIALKHFAESQYAEQPLQGRVSLAAVIGYDRAGGMSMLLVICHLLFFQGQLSGFSQSSFEEDLHGGGLLKIDLDADVDFSISGLLWGAAGLFGPSDCVGSVDCTKLDLAPQDLCTALQCGGVTVSQTLFQYSYMYSVSELWFVNRTLERDGTYHTESSDAVVHDGSQVVYPGRAAAVGLFVASFLWPHIKLFLLHCVVYMRLRPERRRSCCYWLAVFGKWSFTDVLIMITVLGVLDISASSMLAQALLGAYIPTSLWMFSSVDVHVDARLHVHGQSAMYYFCAAVILSLCIGVLVDVLVEAAHRSSATGGHASRKWTSLRPNASCGPRDTARGRSLAGSLGEPAPFTELSRLRRALSGERALCDLATTTRAGGDHLSRCHLHRRRAPAASHLLSEAADELDFFRAPVKASTRARSMSRAWSRDTALAELARIARGGGGVGGGGGGDGGGGGGDGGGGGGGGLQRARIGSSTGVKDTAARAEKRFWSATDVASLDASALGRMSLSSMAAMSLSVYCADPLAELLALSEASGSVVNEGAMHAAAAAPAAAPAAAFAVAASEFAVEKADWLVDIAGDVAAICTDARLDASTLMQRAQAPATLPPLQPIFPGQYVADDDDGDEDDGGDDEAEGPFSGFARLAHTLAVALTLASLIMALRAPLITREVGGSILHAFSSGLELDQSYSLLELGALAARPGGMDLFMSASFLIFVVVGPILRSVTQLVLLIVPMSISRARSLHAVSKHLSIFYALEVLIIAVPMMESTIGGLANGLLTADTLPICATLSGQFGASCLELLVFPSEGYTFLCVHVALYVLTGFDGSLTHARIHRWLHPHDAQAPCCAQSCIVNKSVAGSVRAKVGGNFQDRRKHVSLL